MVSVINVFGFLGLTGGIIGYFGFPSGLKFGIENAINLAEGGMVFPLYMNPPFPTVATYYLYEIKNPKEVLMGQRIKARLKGPFVFNAFIERHNISFAKEGEIVIFESQRLLAAQEDKSYSFDEKFWQINPILPSIAIQIKSIVLDKVPFRSLAEPIVFNTVNLLLDQYKERLIVKKSARQVLEGSKVGLLEFLTQIADRFGLASLLPPGPPENTFGIIHFQNRTIDKIKIYTGVGKTKSKFAEVIAWNNNEFIKFWKGKCQKITGTNGELYKPFVKVGKPIRVFLAQICRSFDLDPVGELTEISGGLKALEYEISSRLYLGARNNPNNKCFCSDLRSYDCQFDGLINMSPCFFDAPIFVTKSGLKGVDKRIKDTVDPETYAVNYPDKQSFYLDPTTGTILKVNLSLTSVIKVMRQPYMRDMARIQELTYAPFFYTNEVLDLPPELTWQIKLLQQLSQYYKPMYAAMSAGGTSLLALKFIVNRFR